MRLASLVAAPHSVLKYRSGLLALSLCQGREQDDEEEARAQKGKQQLVLAAHVSLGKR